MAITFAVDHEQRLVVALARGIVSGDEFFAYQRQAWSSPDVLGYDEIFDLTGVTEIGGATSERMRELAALAGSMDTPSLASKFAIVATKSLIFGLGRMYQAFRELSQGGAKEIQVFYDLQEAQRWLGKDAEPTLTDLRAKAKD